MIAIAKFGARSINGRAMEFVAIGSPAPDNPRAVDVHLKRGFTLDALADALVADPYGGPVASEGTRRGNSVIARWVDD